MTELTWGAGGTYATLVAALNALPDPFVIAGVSRPGSSGWYSIGCHEGIYT